MFHVGHVNILRRAKARCKHLIVGVTSDQYVREHKHKEPYVPFEERVEVLRACRYADEVIGVPYPNCGTDQAYEAYHFDVQFCGSDYENDPWWLEQKAWLEERGSTIVFFPYTMGVSSTMRQEALAKSDEN